MVDYFKKYAVLMIASFVSYLIFKGLVTGEIYENEIFAALVFAAMYLNFGSTWTATFVGIHCFSSVRELSGVEKALFYFFFALNVILTLLAVYYFIVYFTALLLLGRYLLAAGLETIGSFMYAFMVFVFIIVPILIAIVPLVRFKQNDPDFLRI